MVNIEAVPHKKGLAIYILVHHKHRQGIQPQKIHTFRI